MALLTVSVGCGRKCLEDYRCDARKDIHKMVKILSSVQTKEDLIQESTKIKKLIHHLVDLMIEVKDFEYDDSEDWMDALDASDRLKAAMERLYQIEGAREVFEEMQRDGLHKLDLHYREENELS